MPLLSPLVVTCLVLEETAKVLSRVAVPFYILTSNDWEFLLLHVLGSIWCCRFFFFSQSRWCIWLLISFAKPQCHVMLNAWMRPFAICVSSLVKCLSITFLLFSRDANNAGVRSFVIVPQVPETVFFLSILSLFFRLGNFYCAILKITTNSFLCLLCSAIGSIKCCLLKHLF